MQATKKSELESDFIDYLKKQDDKSLLRFLTCGSVDDGKSTLIGRLLFESKLIYEDQLNALQKDSKKFGTTDDEFDFALLVDGLSAEREQGITIDVAYRFFSTETRKFIVIDAPGHEQYTRNMATGASHADLAIVMIDARKGVLTQTKRHSFIVSLLGIKQVILAVNKMDLIDYNQDKFLHIVEDYQQFAESIGIKHIMSIPVSALRGDNVVSKSTQTPWYDGPHLLDYLEKVSTEKNQTTYDFKMPIQWVNRPNLDFRGFTGQVVTGEVHVGDKINILPSGKKATIKEIITYDEQLQKANKGQSITCTLEEEIDISRGDIFTAENAPCEMTEQFEAILLWMVEKPLISGRQYLLRQGTTHALCTPSKPKYRIDVNSLEHLAAKQLLLNEIGCCDFALDRPIAFEPYDKNKNLGGFILIDRMTNETVGAGFIKHSLRRSTNVSRQLLTVDQTSRSSIKPHRPAVLWLTGLSGSGKSTIANLLESKLNHSGAHTILLDGDNIRHGLNQDLGFTEADRAENIRRVAEVAKLMSEAGLITLVSFISPYEAEREMARDLIGKDRFFEIFVDVSLEEAEKRDVKGLYQKARAGEIENFTGINSPYEMPESPDLVIDTLKNSPEDSADMIIEKLKEKDILH